MTHSSGLLLPPDVIQPFLLRFSRDDLHIMASFAGHPDYEAVEAMIRFRNDGSHSIRAIVTRHDQTQIDHVNDSELLAQARGVARQTCHRNISLEVNSQSPQRHARLAFASYRDEQIVLDITSVGPPSAKGAGLSNPGRHSPNSSLPIMWRGASTLAGSQTSVTIDGRSYDVPVKVSTPTFVAHDGYYTEGHAMAVIRAGKVEMVLLRKPSQIEVGAEWIFTAPDGTICYRIASSDPDGSLAITARDGDEIIRGRMVGDRLDITSIALLAGDQLRSGFELAFTEGANFSLSVDEARDLVTGRVQATESTCGTTISLFPALPDWARERCVDVLCSRSGDTLSCVTMIRGREGVAVAR